MLQTPSYYYVHTDFDLLGVWGVGRLLSVRTFNVFPADLSHSLQTLQLNVTSFSHTPEVKNASEDNSPPNSPTGIFFINTSIIISLENICPVSTYCSRSSF